MGSHDWDFRIKESFVNHYFLFGNFFEQRFFLRVEIEKIPIYKKHKQKGIKDMKFAGMVAGFLISAISLCAQGAGADSLPVQSASPKAADCPAAGNCPDASKCPAANGQKIGKGKKSEPTKKAKGFVNRRTRK